MHFEEVERVDYKPNQAIQIDAFRSKIRDQFRAVAQREDNWDGRESKKPNELALENAKHLMGEFLDVVISEGHSWLTPFISSDEDGCVTVAWHKGEHELHLEIAEDEVEYVTVWGIKIDTEMDVGILNRDNYVTLGNCLMDENNLVQDDEELYRNVRGGLESIENSYDDTGKLRI